MEKLKKAHVKAEHFLFEVVKSISNSLQKKEEKTLESFREEAFPLCFEAHAYLSNRNKELMPNYSKELKCLWLSMIKSSKESYSESDEIFWPGVDWHEDESGSFSSGERHNCHTAMFRAKEILGIIGFQKSFERAKLELKDFLLKNDFLFNYSKFSDFWGIARSVTLQRELKEYSKIVSLEIKEQIINADFNKYHDMNKNNVQFLIGAIIFLIISDSEEDIISSAKKAVSRLLDNQKINGSFFDDVYLTCISALAIHLAKVDPSGNFCKKALDWLISKQEKNGNWRSSYFSTYDYYSGFNTLETVIILETLDLITNNEPLPLWALRLQERKPSKIPPVIRFPTPKGTSWYDVSIRFLSNETAELRAGSEQMGKEFTDMGFMDGRTRKPDKLWKVLQLFGLHNGEISWDTLGLPYDVHKNLKKHINRLRVRLKQLFQIDDDPFEEYRRIKAYKTKFKIRHVDKTNL